MLAVVDLVRLHALLQLEQYFDGTSVAFAFRLDFQYAPIVDGKSLQPNNSSLLTIFLADYERLLTDLRALGPDGVKLAKNCRFFTHEGWLDEEDSDEEESDEEELDV
jgi:hypothetical protein